MQQALIIDDDEDYRNLLNRKLNRYYPGIKIIEIDPLTSNLIFPRFHGHIVKHSFSIHTASGSDYQ